MKNLIFFTIDSNYLPHLVTALESFFVLHSSDKFAIGLLYSDLKVDSLGKIKDYIHAKGFTLYSHEIKNHFSSIKVGYHFNKIIFYRLLAPAIFKNHEKILYVDSDVIFLENIDFLFDIDLSSQVLAAVEKTPFYCVPKYLSEKTEKYFASGLLLINTRRFLEDEILERCLEFLDNEYYEMPDQDALNYVIEDWLSLDPSIGVETAFLESRITALNEACMHPKIIQFSGSSKPWHLSNRHPYKKLYWKHRNKTPYRSFVADKLDIMNYIKGLLPLKIRDLVKKAKHWRHFRLRG